MKSIHLFGLAIAIGAIFAAALPGRAQEFETAAVEQAAPSQDSLYRSPAPRNEQLTVAREKAIARGQQRMSRLDAMRWYGFSNSRPTATSIPWTTMYSPAWQQPGGRPFAWYTSSRPITIYHFAPTYR
jgi:hypothetical protein